MMLRSCILLCCYLFQLTTQITAAVVVSHGNNNIDGSSAIRSNTKRKDDIVSIIESTLIDADDVSRTISRGGGRNDDDDDDAMVNVKSNAVGDPDGEGSSDDDDDSDLSDLDENMEEFLDVAAAATTSMEMEYTPNDDDDEKLNDDDSENSYAWKVNAARRSGSRFHPKHICSSNDATSTEQIEQLHRVWKQYVYLPPSPKAVTVLQEKARVMDGDSKTRLDRRTLYAGLLLQWMVVSSNGNTRRPFLDQPISHLLQAAVSLATQPEWRRSLPQSSASAGCCGMRLYECGEDVATCYRKSCCTLSMQETIAMGLVRLLLLFTICARARSFWD